MRARAHRLQFLPQPPLPEVPGRAARQWLEDREAELLPVPYYHVVFTLPASIGAVAFQNKAAVYDLLFRTAAETLTAIAADPKHLGARIGLTAVYLGFGAHPSSARPRHRARRRPVAGRVALDRLQARLLPARACAVASLPPPLPRRPRSPACGRPPRLPRRPCPARRQTRLRRRARPAAPRGMGGLRQEAVRLATGRPRLSRPLHPSRRDLDSASSRSTRRASHSNGRTIGSKDATGSGP